MVAEGQAHLRHPPVKLLPVAVVVLLPQPHRQPQQFPGPPLPTLGLALSFGPAPRPGSAVGEPDTCAASLGGRICLRSCGLGPSPSPLGNSWGLPLGPPGGGAWAAPGRPWLGPYRRPSGGPAPQPPSSQYRRCRPPESPEPQPAIPGTSGPHGPWLGAGRPG